jgi:hypothetical protein
VSGAGEGEGIRAERVRGLRGGFVGVFEEVRLRLEAVGAATALEEAAVRFADFFF